MTSQITWVARAERILECFIFMQMTPMNMASVASPPVLEYIINSGLHILSTWLRQNYLQINASKTQTMTLGPVPYR